MVVAILGWLALCTILVVAMLAGRATESRLRRGDAASSLLLKGMVLAAARTGSNPVCGLPRAKTTSMEFIEVGPAEAARLARCFQRHGYLTAAEARTVINGQPATAVRWFPVEWQIPPSRPSVLLLLVVVAAPFATLCGAHLLRRRRAA